jgi:hypothetical protein
LLQVQDQAPLHFVTFLPHEHREAGDHWLALDELSHLIEGAKALEVALLLVVQDLLERRLVSVEARVVREVLGQ